MDSIRTLDLTKNESVDALELLGASLATKRTFQGFIGYGYDVAEGFHYLKLGMEERFSDLSYPLFKQPMEPVEAYQKRKESQTPEELAQIENNTDALFMESLVIRERILGKNNPKLSGRIISVAEYYKTHDIIKFSLLYKYAIRIAHNSNKSATRWLDSLVSGLMERAPYKYSPRANDIVELGNLIVLEYELQEKILRETESSSNKKGSKWLKVDMLCLFRSSWQLVQLVAKYKLCDDDEVSLVLKKLVRKDPHLHKRNTLLHEAVVNYGWLSGPETVRILVKAGMNVNAVDHNGDTPLHIAVTSRPWRDEIHCLMDILQLLFDGGAHHDFVNNNGKTPMDLAVTDEARMILLERRNLELQCISAKAVKKFGIPYLGVVPKVLEKYINMH
ncbi:protein fem-1 homolog B-like [Porites lutea]|uniref:protein fem-1 homolog B-like n=1 Tax=Porites lutea TaxID=51062 RepID=UPI003CC59FAD